MPVRKIIFSNERRKKRNSRYNSNFFLQVIFTIGAVLVPQGTIFVPLFKIPSGISAELYHVRHSAPALQYHGFLLVGCGCALIEAYGVYCLNMQAVAVCIDLPNHRRKEMHMINRADFTKSNMADRAEHQTV